MNIGKGGDDLSTHRIRGKRYRQGDEPPRKKKGRSLLRSNRQRVEGGGFHEGLEEDMQVRRI